MKATAITMALRSRISVRDLGRCGPVTTAGLLVREHMKLRIVARRASTSNGGIGRVGSGGNHRSGEEETIEAVFVFHRHGDRTPGKSLVADEFAKEETLFWQTKIPPSDRSYHHMLSERFPVVRLGPSDKQDNDNDNHKGSSTLVSSSSSFLFKETLGGNESYGFLTWKGMHQMYHNGVAMADRYCHGRTQLFQDHWDIKAFSTNYLRTVKSCQTFLDGLLSNDNRNSVRCADRKRTDRVLLDYKQPTHYEGIDLEEYRKTSTTKDSSTSSMVEIKVRDVKDETLNAFDRSPELMKDLMRDVVVTPDFVEKDTRAAPLKAQLFEFVPGLSRYSSYFGKSFPSAINWVSGKEI